jgi:hypothetical protein
MKENTHVFSHSADRGDFEAKGGGFDDTPHRHPSTPTPQMPKRVDPPTDEAIVTALLVGHAFLRSKYQVSDIESVWFSPDSKAGRFTVTTSDDSLPKEGTAGVIEGGMQSLIGDNSFTPPFQVAEGIPMRAEMAALASSSVATLGAFHVRTAVFEKPNKLNVMIALGVAPPPKVKVPKSDPSASTSSQKTDAKKNRGQIPVDTAPKRSEGPPLEDDDVDACADRLLLTVLNMLPRDLSDAETKTLTFALNGKMRLEMHRLVNASYTRGFLAGKGMHS